MPGENADSGLLATLLTALAAWFLLEILLPVAGLLFVGAGLVAVVKHESPHCLTTFANFPPG